MPEVKNFREIFRAIFENRKTHKHTIITCFKSQVQDLMRDSYEFEQTFVYVRTGSRNIIILGVYFPPKSSIDAYTFFFKFF